MKALPDDPAATAADRELIRRTYELAESAVARGNHPFGALLVHQGKVIAEFENAVITSKDVTQHAETGLVSEASRQFDATTLSESTLYTSTEPRLMCSGAIHWAGIGKIVYGTTASRMFEAAGGHERGIPVREAFARLASSVEIVGPVMEEEGLAIHLDYWPGT